jgi:hypothetical protein
MFVETGRIYNYYSLTINGIVLSRRKYRKTEEHTGEYGISLIPVVK